MSKLRVLMAIRSPDPDAVAEDEEAPESLEELKRVKGVGLGLTSLGLECKGYD